MIGAENRGRVVAAKLRRCVYASAAAAVMAVSFAARANAGDIVKITFCNETPRPAFAAIAYWEGYIISKGSMERSTTSRGWLKVPTGGCASFAGNYRFSTFYYRGETDPYPVGGRWKKGSWGDGNKKFLVQDDGFEFDNSGWAKRNGNMRLEKFSQFLSFDDLPITRLDPEDTEAKITFTADGGVHQVAEPIAALKASPLNDVIELF
jgi:hypothetical protein